MKRLFVLGLIFALLAGCGRAPQPQPQQGTPAPPVITLWHSCQGPALAGVEKAQQELAQTNPSFMLQLVYVPADQFFTRLAQAQAADKGPDLFLVPREKIPELFTAGEIQPLNRLFETGAYFPSAVQALSFNGSVMGVPESVTVPILAYNKDLSPNPPSSLEQMLTQAGKVAKGTTPGLGGDLSDLFLTGGLFKAYGGSFYTPDQLPSLNSAGSIAFLQGIAALAGIKAGLYDPKASQALLAAGATPFGLLDSSQLSAYKSLGKNLGYAPIPGPGGKPLQNYVEAKGFVIAADTGFPKQAAAAAVFLSSPGVVTLYAPGDYPAVTAAYEQKPLQADSNAQLVKSIAASGAGYPLDSRTNLLMPFLSQAVKDVLANTDPATAAQNAQNKAYPALGLKQP